MYICIYAANASEHQPMAIMCSSIHDDHNNACI